MAPVTEDLVHRCLAHLSALPFVERAVLHTRSLADDLDGSVELDTLDGRETLPCEVRRGHLGRESAEHLAHIQTRHPGLIVLAPAVGREIGDLFERSGVNFVDAAGNCSLRIGRRYVARIQGRAAAKRAVVDRGIRAPGYRVLFALLVKTDLVAAPSRDLASAVGVSPQTANDMRRRLVEGGLLLEARGHRDWAPGRRKDALASWLEGFATTLAPSLLIGRFRAMERDPEALERRIEPVLDAACTWRYGGGAAAARLTEHYRGDTTLIYTLDAPTDLPARLRLVPDPRSGPIVLARAPGVVAFESPGARSVHPLLAYADLLSDGGDRAREAAAELHRRYLVELETA